MRAEIIENLVKEVIGPRRGSLEKIPFDPWQEYISGVIIPRSWKSKNKGAANSPDVEILKEEVTNSDEDFLSDEINATTESELDPRYQTKSFGISFILDSLNPAFNICTTWGMYKQESLIKSGSNENNESDGEWTRESYGKITSVSLNSTDTHSKITLYDFEDNGNIYLYIKKVPLSNDKSHISVYLVNDLRIKKNDETFHPNTDSCIFQPSIRINFDESDSLINMDPISSKSSEMQFLYRNQPVKASGHMCAAIWDEIDYYEHFNIEIMWPDYKIQCQNDSDFELFKRPNIRSEFIPIYPMPLSSFDIDNDISLKADELSEDYDPKILSDKLGLLVDSYGNWIDENNSKKAEISDSAIFENIIKNEKVAYERMMNGVNILKNDEIARLAFCFANKAIALQNKWAGRTEFKWRPYQIAFFLMNIDSLVHKNSKEKNILDLLWIPTGGGKTEAYLAIMAFIISFRRLKSYQSSDICGGGVSVISRYTLRLLTVQQFRRTLKLVTAAELLRIHQNNDGSIGWRPEECNLEGDWIYGSMRYSAGMWVGGGVSPLTLLDTEKGAITSLKDDNKNDASQLIKCPVCGNWLAIPHNGITKEENKIHIVLKSKYPEIDICDKITSLKNKFKSISKISITTENHLMNYFTLSLEFETDMTKHDLKEIFDNLETHFEFGSLNKFKLGYFNSLSKIPGKRKKDEAYDFEIWCTNPECDLNNVSWREGVPFKESNFQFPDGNFERVIESPFEKNKRMPIPGYTIDEHVYYRCPTVVISTADKIARLAFEPRAAALFGNISKYNRYYGYYRENLLPKKSSKASLNEFVNVPKFNSPDLIIQDELHLMDGPLGSLFGLYETMVDAIIKNNGGNPKYIASTATINNADKQAHTLFSKDLFQFPPAGLTIEDSFFVKGGEFNDGFDEKNPGRLYMGVYAPGKGPLTPLIRLWTRILKSSKDLENDELISKYWTLVGYFNAIRELGGGIALYNDDIHARLDTITKSEYDGALDITDEKFDYNIRELNSENVLELSSRIDSTQLPLILDELERDGKNNKKPDFDAIFTTSMFGTGVDISHLSLMIMAGQPKTTGDYIQATGRIGRDNGGLIVTLFRSGKPRDLNHYEMFSSYHSRIHLDVEPVSVSPFSKGALEKGLGPSIVAFLRNSSNLNSNWFEDDGKSILTDNAQKDLELTEHLILDRLKNSGFTDEKISEISKIFNIYIDKWKKIAKQDNELKFNEYNPFNKLKYNVVLGDLAHESEDLEVVYENAPQSLREIEETIGFWV